MFCPQCGNAVEATAKFCSVCGGKLSRAIAEARVPEAKANMDDQELALENPDIEKAGDGVGGSEDLYKAILGPKNQEYYLRHFRRFDSDGTTSNSWHWPALFVTLYWLLYRKMWLNALAYFLLPIILIVLLVIGASAGMSGNAIVGASVLFYVFTWLLPPLYANAIYYKHCQRIIKKTRSSSLDLPGLLGGLSRKGGTGNVVLIMALVVASIGLAAAKAIPKYQEYITRVDLSDGISEAESVESNAPKPVESLPEDQQEPITANLTTHPGDWNRGQNVQNGVNLFLSAHASGGMDGAQAYVENCYQSALKMPLQNGEKLQQMGLCISADLAAYRVYDFIATRYSADLARFRQQEQAKLDKGTQLDFGNNPFMDPELLADHIRRQEEQAKRDADNVLLNSPFTKAQMLRQAEEAYRERNPSPRPTIEFFVLDNVSKRVDRISEWYPDPEQRAQIIGDLIEKVETQLNTLTELKGIRGQFSHDSD